MKRRELARITTILQALGFPAVIVVFAGCGHLPGGEGWGARAAYPVDWHRIPVAAKRAALDPITYVPLLGAGVIAAGDFDHRISDWARDHTPLFGSTDNAKNYSDIGRTVLVAEGFGTALLTPSGNDAGEWAWSKARGLVVEGAAFGLTSVSTEGLKSGISRERPDRSGDDSMPSGHASSAFSGMALANRNLDYIQMHPYTRNGIKAANVAAAASVAWARVEGEKHYPADVLVGAALGNFLTRFVHDAFMNLDEHEQFSFYLEPAPDGGKLFLTWEF
jgi:membrane-associated phospholipid phosphatase